MARRTAQVQETPAHPVCCLCRDGTHATMSLQMFDQEDYPWSNYCDICGKAMLSVLKDAQGRDAVTKTLIPPAPVKSLPVPTTKPARSAIMEALTDVDNVPPPKKPTPPPKKPAPAPPPLGYDLLAMLGMPKKR